MKIFHKYISTTFICLVAIGILSTNTICAQAQSKQTQTLSKGQLDQLVAPIALYPDDLLTQVLMASTYPLEIVQAARWVSRNSKLKGKALEDSAKKQSWDPSVKSVVIVSQVIEMMNNKLDWTQQLGDAFLAQQEDVLAAVQRLRAKADKAGNFKTTGQQKVQKKTVQSKTVYVVQSVNPEVVYVPVYNPTYIYGAWSYPAYPPYYWYPRGYVASRAIWFGTGVAVGAALWGNVHWGSNNVNINVNRYNNFNRTNIKNGNWNHNSFHRKGVPYRDQAVKKRYGKSRPDTRSREQFRGRAKSGQNDLSRSSRRDGARKQARKATSKRDGKPRQAKPTVRKPAKKVASRTPASRKKLNRTKTSQRGSRRPSAYDGVGRSKQVRKHSQRGRTSRQASARRYGGGGRGGRGGGGRRR